MWRIQKGSPREGTEVQILDIAQSKTFLKGHSLRDNTGLQQLTYLAQSENMMYQDRNMWNKFLSYTAFCTQPIALHSTVILLKRKRLLAYSHTEYTEPTYWPWTLWIPLHWCRISLVHGQSAITLKSSLSFFWFRLFTYSAVNIKKQNKSSLSYYLPWIPVSQNTNIAWSENTNFISGWLS